MVETLKHHVVYLNGLGQAGVSDEGPKLSRHLKSPTVDITHLPIDWRAGDSFWNIFEMVSKYTKNSLNLYGRVALVGASAGGSLALNVFHDIRSQYQNLELSVICLSARLRLGNLITLGSEAPDFGGKDIVPAYIESVSQCESVAVPNLSTEDKRLIRTLTPFEDQVVPVETMTIPEVENHLVQANGHFRGIARGLLMIPGILDNMAHN